jgi:hypothetical protein
MMCILGVANARKTTVVYRFPSCFIYLGRRNELSYGRCGILWGSWSNLIVFKAEQHPCVLSSHCLGIPSCGRKEIRVLGISWTVCLIYSVFTNQLQYIYIYIYIYTKFKFFLSYVRESSSCHSTLYTILNFSDILLSVEYSCVHIQVYIYFI